MIAYRSTSLSSSTLVVTPSVPFARHGTQLYLDIKAVEGLKKYAALWPGRVRCLMGLGDRAHIPFGKAYDAADLPFEIEQRSDNVQDHAALFDDAAMVLAAGDNYPDLDIPATTRTPTVFVIENTLMTRMRILRLSQGLSFRTAKSMAWIMLREPSRRRAFARAAGLQANGTPAYESYRHLSNAPMRYFDTRMTQAQHVTQDEVDRKVRQAIDGHPLRLAFSGRLAAIKGVDHLVPFAQALDRTGTPFLLDIYGDGPLRSSMQDAVVGAGLEAKVRLHGSISFDDALVPTLKREIDLFICCHRQADPSCTYMETLGCGVPIVGYDNAAFKGVAALGDVGRTVAMDDIDALVAAVVALSADRPALAKMIRAAAQVSRTHSFEQVVQQRIDHMRSIAQI